MKPIYASFNALDIATLFHECPERVQYLDPHCPHTDGDPAYKFIDYSYDELPPLFAQDALVEALSEADQQLNVGYAGTFTVRFLLYPAVPVGERLKAAEPHFDDSYCTWVIWDSTGGKPAFYRGKHAGNPTPHHYKAAQKIARAAVVLFYNK